MAPSILRRDPNPVDESAERPAAGGQGHPVRRGECQVASDEWRDLEKNT
jgi:hypothetical protein